MNNASKISRGHKFSIGGAALAVLCFFLPWVLASCEGEQANISGWQFTFGKDLGSGYYTQHIAGKPVLILILLAALAVFVLVYLAWKRGSLTTLDAYGPIGLSALALIILLVQFSGFKDQAAQQSVTIEYQFGLYGVVIGYLIVIVGGVLNLPKKPKV